MEKEIELALKNYLDAFNDGRWEDLKKILDDSFTYYTDNCTIQNKQQFIDFMSNNAWNSINYKVSDLDIIISENNDLVIACYKAEFTGTYEGKQSVVYAIETTILKHVKGEWKIIHSHTSNK